LNQDQPNWRGRSEKRTLGPDVLVTPRRHAALSVSQSSAQVDFGVFQDGAHRDFHSLIAPTAGAFVVMRAILSANSKAVPQAIR